MFVKLLRGPTLTSQRHENDTGVRDGPHWTISVIMCDNAFTNLVLQCRNS